MVQFSFFILFLLFSLNSVSQPNNHEDVYLYSYFKNNGKSGLHFLWSEDGIKWHKLNGRKSFLKPTVGTQLMRDPCIHKDNKGIYHMVWTTGWMDKGIGYASSKDLINWSKQKFISIDINGENVRNCWAPEIYFDEHTEEYMIYWSSTIPGKYPNTDKSGDNNYNHRIYSFITKDFNSFSQAKLLYNPNKNVIDATIIRVENKYWMFLKDETRTPVEKNIKIAKSDSLAGSYSPLINAISQKEWIEGPSAIKINNEIRVYFDQYVKKRIGMYSSTDGINWENRTQELKIPSHVRHGTVIRIARTELRKLLKS